MAEVMDLECPGCGRPVTLGQKECSCGRPLVISSMSSLRGLPAMGVNKYSRFFQDALTRQPGSPELSNSLAVCYLQLKLYDKAYEAFDKAIEADIHQSESYFYAAIALLGGQKAFVTPRAKIDRIEQLLAAGTMIEPRSVYYLLWAYIKYDYYHRKFFHTDPDYRGMLEMAEECGCTDADRTMLFDLLGVPCPEEMFE